MKNPTKLDFFVGSFISCIINSAKKVPALIDETDNSKIIKLTTDNGDYNIYLKYSTNIRYSTRKKDGTEKVKITCDVLFNSKEYERLKNNFYEEKSTNLFILVLTASQLSEPRIVAIPYDIGMKCLLAEDSNGTRRLTITKLGKEHTYNCYGIGDTGKIDNRVYVNWQKYFDN